MIDNSLLAALQTGPHTPAKSVLGLRKPQAVAQPESAEDPQKDRLDLTPASAQGGFRSFAFQFRHLAIRREIAAVRSATQESKPEAQESDGPDSTSYRGVQEERQTELSLFYARTQTISVGLNQDTADHFQSTGQNVGRTFEVSISLDASFLYQFTGQSETLSEGDQALFDKYLSATDQMTGISGEAAQGFFDMVDQALKDTRSAVMDGLDGFLNDVGASFGLEGDALTNFKSQVAEQVAGFFADLDKFVNESRDLLTGAALPQGDAPKAVALAPADTPKTITAPPVQGDVLKAVAPAS